MAVFRPGSTVGQISGALGGVVFGKGRGAGVLRVNAGSRARTSAASVLSRARAVSARQRWGLLTEVQRGAWNAWAAAYDAAAGVGADRVPSGFNRFVAVNTYRAFTDLVPLLSPLDPGVGSAEPPFVDVWADESTGVGRVQMLLPLLDVDRAPVRVIVYLSAARQPLLRSEPKAWRPWLWFNPRPSQPGIDGPPIFAPLPPSAFARSSWWASAVLIGGSGNVSPRTLWPLDVLPASSTWALRIRPFIGGVSMNSVERTVAGQLVFRGDQVGGSFVDPHNLGVAPNVTIGDLASTIDSISPWEVVDVNPAVAGRSSLDLPVMPLLVRQLETQPVLLSVLT